MYNYLLYCWKDYGKSLLNLNHVVKASILSDIVLKNYIKLRVAISLKFELNVARPVNEHCK